MKNVCDCIEKVNAKLEPTGRYLKTYQTIDTKTFEMGFDLALDLLPLKKGIKASKMFMAYCPFCGKKKTP